MCLACTFLLYGLIAPTQLCLLIGGTNFAYFPIVQYMPYFLAGVCYSAGDKYRRLIIGGIAVLCSTAGALQVISQNGAIPSSFPPSWAWVLLPAGAVALSSLICIGLHTLRGPLEKYVVLPMTAMLSSLGTRSLYYLLGSNLVLFTLSGRDIVPQIARKSILPWTQPIQSPLGALCWTLNMMLTLAFVAKIAGRGRPASSKS